jgi:DNA-nicking Smr family endonuclease
MKKEKKASWPTLDLHGFKTADVNDAVDRFLVQQTSRHSQRIRIMTGKGTGAVLKMVTAYLKLGGYPWEFEKLENGSRNEGVLVVILD